jgi:hypothetical protein
MSSDNHKLAARRLLKSLNAPSWAVSVMAWGENDSKSLVILVDPAYNFMGKVLAEFEGYPVILRERSTASPHERMFA